MMCGYNTDGFAERPVSRAAYSLVRVGIAAGVITILASCTSFLNVEPQMETTIDRSVEVRGLVLKFALVDIPDEIYEAAVTRVDRYREVYQITPVATSHHAWLMTTWDSLPSERRKELQVIATRAPSWQLMKLTQQLRDDATLEDVMRLLASAGVLSGAPGLTRDVKNAISSFYPYFYETYLSDYLAKVGPDFRSRAEQLNNEVDASVDLFDFMERQSGIQFRRRYHALFYFTTRVIGATGFTYGNLYISTIQTTVEDAETLFYTPLHEFMHQPYKTVSSSPAFRRITEKLKTVPSLRAPWESGYRRSYNWVGWCEENLVEGFAMYLRYRFTGSPQLTSTYVYDRQFYDYLISIDFSPDKLSLIDASIDFYLQVLERDAELSVDQLPGRGV